MSKYEDMPAWWRRLQVVRERHPELSIRELARRGGLSHTTVTNIFTGIHLTPERKTLAQLVFTLTEQPNEREAILSAFDDAIEKAERAAFDARHAGVEVPPSEIEILTLAVNNLTTAITTLTDAIKGQAEG